MAWGFGEEIYAGTCTGWKKKDNVLGYAIWFVCYDDGDTEVFNVAHGARHGSAECAALSRRCVKHRACN